MYFSFTFYLCIYLRSKILLLLLFVLITIKLTPWSTNLSPSHSHFSFGIICGLYGRGSFAVHLGDHLRHCATVSVIIQVSFDWPRDLRPRPWWIDLSLSLGQYINASVWDFPVMTSLSVDKWYVINDNTENNFCFIFCFSPFVGLSGNFTSSSLPRPPGHD